ncbi:hypothetical protein PPYR_00009 [Photinus pyralis]|uniref:Tesmin/TSO1-like CXC domain-containing protein n=1 Tax=Photinus pyralis TaxID=7054 RepID=A0A5N4B0C0_PHOPY|nr:hypothetical protein PPYR_00009 [Photinus pyralis]
MLSFARNDKWGLEIFNKINNQIDLVAAEAIYHVNCFNKFMQDKSQDHVGRPVNPPLEEAFEKICNFIENDSENCQFAIKELIEMMITLLPESFQPWSEKNLKMRLKKKYKDSIIISSLSGKQSIVSFRGNCEKLLSEEWSKDKTFDRAKIVTAAAKILREDIRGMTCNLQNYPNLDDIKTGGTEEFPDSLKSFFHELVLKDKKNLAAYTTKFYNKPAKSGLKTVTMPEIQFLKPEVEKIAARLDALWPKKSKEDIDTLRYTLYNRITSRQGLSANFNLAALPPTKDAAVQHVLRVYYQVQEWIGCKLNPLAYGWQRDREGHLVPTSATKEIAPPDILKMVFCNCKEASCGKSCSCKKLGLRCSSKCGQCLGIDCCNSCIIPENDEDENDVFI